MMFERQKIDTFSEVKAYALKGMLLDRKFIDSLIPSKSLEEMMEKLAASPYKEVINLIKPPFTATKIESALRAHLALQYYQLGRWFPFSSVILAYFKRLIGWDLKIVIKAKLEGKTFDEVKDSIFLKAEEILKRRELIVKLMAASTLKEGLELLRGDPFYEPLKQALKEFEERKDPTIFDIYIDREVYNGIARVLTEKIDRRLKEAFESFIRHDIRTYNILSVLRAKALDLPSTTIEKLVVFIERREVEAIRIRRLIRARSVEEIADIIRRLGYIELGKIESLHDLITFLEKRSLEKDYELAKITFYKEPTPAAVLAYLKLKEFEIENLSKIAFGIEFNLPREEIAKKLILS